MLVPAIVKRKLDEDRTTNKIMTRTRYRPVVIESRQSGSVRIANESIPLSQFLSGSSLVALLNFIRSYDHLRYHSRYRFFFLFY